MRIIKGFILRGGKWADDCQKNLDEHGLHRGQFLWIYRSKEEFQLINGGVHPDLDDVIPIEIKVG